MRTKHLFMALTASAFFAACQDQDVVTAPDGYADGQLIKLEKGFALLGSTEGDASTRGQWESTTAGVKFFWRPNLMTGETKKYTPDEIGLAWTGVCLDGSGNQTAGSLLSAADGRVFTNYKFNHFGWKKNGIEPTVDPCSGTGDYKAGTFTPVNTYSDGTNTLAGGYDATTGQTTYTASADAITKWPGYTTANGETNGSEGLFNTNNSTVYAGEYIVYAPYDKTNTSNYIVATTKDNFTVTKFVTDDAKRGETINEFTNEIFKYGLTTITDGGSKTTKFATQNLNGYVGLKLQGKAGEASLIKKVILYDPSSSHLLTKVGLSSKGIVEGKAGKSLYLTNNEVKKEYAETISATIGTPAVAETGNKFSYITIPALPTETAIPELQIILINGDNKAFIVSKTDISIERNAYATGAWIEIKNIDFADAPLIVTDEIAMKAAITASKTNGGTVRLLGNIELSSSYAMDGVAAGKTITVTGGKIIVPDVTGATAISLSIPTGYVVNSNIDVKQSCCKDKGGELNITGAATLGGIVNIGEDAAVEDDNHEAKLNFSGEATKSILKGTVNNYGIATIAKATTANTASHEVNVKGGTINNNDRFFIETTGATTQQDAKLFVETGALNNASGAKMTVSGVLAVGNSATATNVGMVIDKISSQVTGNINTLGLAPGEYISEVDEPTNRFEAALYNRPTTTVKFVQTAAKDYDLDKLNNTRLRKSITTYEVAGTAKATFTTAKEAENIVAVMKNLVVDASSELDIKSHSTYSGTKDRYLTIKVEALKVAGTMTVTESKDNTKTIINVNALTVNSTGKVAVGKFVCSDLGALTVEKLNSAKGSITFDFSSQTWVSGLINIQGTADILQATATGGTNVAGDVWYTGTIVPQGDGNWLHGIPTPNTK